MNRSNRILPVYTGDVSGVCSALFELGGMVVMHDPSGCNSTYNTHDETRWYDHDSLIFLSGLSELDAILGNDDKLIHDVAETAAQTQPRFIALANSPIPYMNGTDFVGICKEIESITGIPTFHIPTNGMHDYIHGGSQALAEIARRFVAPPMRKRPRSVNLLGLTPLDFAAKGTVDSLRRLLEQAGWEVTSCWAMGDDLEQLSHAGEASVSLVVSSMGLAAAKVLWERFQVPFVVKMPLFDTKNALFLALEEASSVCRPIIPLPEKKMSENSDIYIIGEPVVSASIAEQLPVFHQKQISVLCPLEPISEFLPYVRYVQGESEVEEALRGASVVIADPLYRPVCPSSARFIPLPHLAFSGRCFLSSIPNYFDPRFLLEVLHESE